MSYGWKHLKVPRFYGLDKKTNVVDVKDGLSIDLFNCFQDERGLVKKRRGNAVLFANDETAGMDIDEIGTCVLSGTRYYFQFSNGKFQYSTSVTGSKTEITPSPAISTTNQIWWVVLDDKLFFVDGSNDLRFFNGSTILESSIAERPTAAMSSTDNFTGGYDFCYTYDERIGTYNLGESPRSLESDSLINYDPTISVTIAGPIYGSRNIKEGDIFRVYRKATSVAAASLLAVEYTATAADETGNSVTISTSAPAEDAAQLYTEQGLAINVKAPTALVGITEHYGRLIGWKSSTVYVSKVSNPHSFPTEDAVNEAFVYSFLKGDGEDIKVCISYRESLFVMKRTNVAIFVGVGPDDTGNNPFTFRRLQVNGNGCIAPKSAAVVGSEERTFLIYLASSGFYATDGNEPVRVGENIEIDIQDVSQSIKQTSVGFHDKRFGLYCCLVGGATTRVMFMLDVRKDSKDLVGWFYSNALPFKCVSYDDTDNKYLAGTYLGYSVYQRIAGTSADLSDPYVEFVNPSAINTATEEITVTKDYTTADPVIFRTNGTIPTGLANNTTYYVIRVSATVIKLASSSANATAGTAINITSQGAGVHTIVSKVAIDAYYTTNWINFGSTSLVKKLSKPSFIFNAQATEVNVDVRMAYDWFNSFSAPLNIAIQSTDHWGTIAWGTFVWGSGAVASPKNLAIPRRKVRSIRYKFENDTIDQDLHLQGFEQQFAYLRNRGNFST